MLELIAFVSVEHLLPCATAIMDTKSGNMGKVPASKLSLKWDDTQTIGIIIAIVVVLITMGIFAIYFTRRIKKRLILLVGASDSGKTLLFSQLVYGKHCDTYTSIKENIGEFELNDRRLQVVDIPGQERVRDRIFDEYKSGALGIVFVIDTTNTPEQLRDVAEYLYTVLSDDVVQSSNPNILLLFNKRDEEKSISSSEMKPLLEDAMNLIRKTKSGANISSISKKTPDVFLGKQGSDFTFEQLSDMKISFGDSSAAAATKSEEEEAVESDDEDEKGLFLNDLEDWLCGIS